MRATFLALLLLLPCARAGHPISLSDTSWPNASTPSILPDGIWLRWRASDLSSSPVSSWSDEIQGWTWTQSSGANQPTWSTNGVTFNGSSQYFTSSNLIAQTTLGAVSEGQAWLIISKFSTTTGTHVLLGDSSRCTGGFIFYAIDSDILYEELGSGPSPVPTALFDFLTVPSATNSYRAYTNGVSAWTNASGWNDGVSFNRIGSSGDGTLCQFHGDLQEIIVWTNVIFTSTQVSNIHHYATNTYPITP